MILDVEEKTIAYRFVYLGRWVIRIASLEAEMATHILRNLAEHAEAPVAPTWYFVKVESLRALFRSEISSVVRLWEMESVY